VKTTTAKRWLNFLDADRECRFRPIADILNGTATSHGGWIVGALATP
jgi:hypothetical protein